MHRLAIAFVLSLFSLPSHALIFSVSFDDPGSVFSSFYQNITADVQAAGSIWGSHIAGNASLEVSVAFADIPTATGASVTTNFLRNTSRGSVFEQGAAAEIRTGIDPNGSGADIRFTIGKSYLQNELWFDPNPLTRTAIVPSNKTDAVSVLLHEFGHAFAFNGFLNGVTGASSGALSTFDEFVTFSAGNLFFTGPQAESVYGGPVPLSTGGFYQHLGTAFGPGSDLISDLMNGVAFFRGTRYNISPLDLAISSDAGLAVFTVAEPPVFWLALLLLFTCVGMQRASGRGRRQKPTTASAGYLCSAQRG